MIISPLLSFAQADTPNATAAPTSAVKNESTNWWRSIAVNGFLSAAFSYNTNEPASHLNQLRVFDFDDGMPKLDAAEIVIQRPASKANDFGFRMDVVAGSSIPEAEASYGLFRSKYTGLGEHIDIQQLLVSYVVPVGKGLRIDAGKMNTHMGYEVVEGYDGYNENYSRGFIFGYAVPFTNTGVRATCPVHEKLTAMAMVTNGWDNVHDNNTGKSLGAQLLWQPAKSTAVYFNVIHGPEASRNNHDQRSVFELVGTWKTTPKLSLAIDALYGHEEEAGLGHDVLWRGLAGYAKYAFTNRLSVAFRGEVFADNAGVRTGTVQTLRGFTLTPEFKIPAKLSATSKSLRKLDGSFVVRGDLRLDRSDRDVFQKQNGLTNSQFTSAVNLIYFF